jgi:hypothetical protein
MNPLQAGKVKKMDVTTVRQIRQILEDNLPSIMEENNLKFDLGNGTYDDDSVKFQFRISLLHALSPEEKALKGQIDFRRSYDGLVTLDDSIIAEERGQQFKLVGYKPRARKKPFIIEDIKTGGRYVCPESMAERLFKEVK